MELVEVSNQIAGISQNLGKSSSWMIVWEMVVVDRLKRRVMIHYYLVELLSCMILRTQLFSTGIYDWRHVWFDRCNRATLGWSIIIPYGSLGSSHVGTKKFVNKLLGGLVICFVWRLGHLISLKINRNWSLSQEWYQPEDPSHVGELWSRGCLTSSRGSVLSEVILFRVSRNWKSM